MIVADGTLVTLDPQRRVIDNGAVLIKGNIIEAVGDAEEIKSGTDAISVLDAKGNLIFPGLVNTHTHIFQALLRGIGQDMPVWEWFAKTLDTFPRKTVTSPRSWAQSRLSSPVLRVSSTTTIRIRNPGWQMRPSGHSRRLAFGQSWLAVS